MGTQFDSKIAAFKAHAADLLNKKAEFSFVFVHFGTIGLFAEKMHFMLSAAEQILRPNAIDITILDNGLICLIRSANNENILRNFCTQLYVLLSQTNAETIPHFALREVAAPKFVNSVDDAIHKLEYLTHHCPDRSLCVFFGEKHLVNYEQYRCGNKLLRDIIDKNFVFILQPIIDTKDFSIIHYECLLRLASEKGKSVYPLISYAEHVGLIDMVDELVISMAADLLKSKETIKLGINISGSGVLSATLKERMRNLFSDKSLASRLIIEFTESMLVASANQTIEFIQFCKSLGCEVAIDDFGAGSTCISQIYNMPFDIIKIDGQLIRDIKLGSAPILSSIVSMISKNGITVIAEYVEDQETMDVLIGMGVRYMQGYLFHKGAIAQ